MKDENPFGIFSNNKKLAIMLLVASLLIESFYLALLVIKLTNQGFQPTTNIVLPSSCHQYFMTKYQSLSIFNTCTNVLLIVGTVTGLFLILKSIFLLLKHP